MSIDNLLSGLIGAVIGVAGALSVALVTHWLNETRRARDAARAVFYELQINRSVLEVSALLGWLIPHPIETNAWSVGLSRLAGWLSPTQFHDLLMAYADIAATVGLYRPGGPLDARAAGQLAAAGQRLTTAINMLSDRVFSPREREEYVRTMDEFTRQQREELAKQRRQTPNEP